MSEIHDQLLRGIGLSSNRFTQFEDFVPLSAHEFKSLSQEDGILALDDVQLERLWLVPIQRWLQQEFRIDQRGYDTGTIPTLAQLTEDFKVAAALTVDHFWKNRDEVVGQESVNGAGSRIWSHAVPARAKQLLARYRFDGGRVGRA